VTGINRIGPSIRSGPEFCPRVNATVEGSPEILVASGWPKSIRVKVDNLAQFIIQTRFVCQFSIEGRVTSFNAQLLKDTIYCTTVLDYTSRSPSIEATFDVIWGDNKKLDNPDNIHVIVYKCKELASHQGCDMCLNIDEKYQCGWCKVNKKCEVADMCGIGNSQDWISHNQTCPSPRGSLG